MSAPAVLDEAESGYKRLMGLPHETTRDILAACWGVSDSEMDRARRALERAGLIHPWRDDADEWRFGRSDALRVKRLLTLLQEGKTLESALLKIRAELLLVEADQLLVTNKGLRAPVKVRPEPWWMRCLRRLFGVWRPPRSTVWMSETSASRELLSRSHQKRREPHGRRSTPRGLSRRPTAVGR